MSLSKNPVFNYILIIMVSVMSFPVLADRAEWAAFQASGEDAFSQKNYTDAEKLFKRALSIAKDELKKTKSHAKTLYFLGKVKMVQKLPYKAIGFFEKAIKIRRRRFGKTHEQTLLAMIALAEARIKSGKPHYAEPLFKKVAEARSKELGAKNPKVIDVKAKLASLMLVLGKPKKALPLFKLVTETGKATDMEPQKLARLYDEYGRALRQTGKTALAEKMETNAIQLRAKSGDDSGFVVTTKSNTGKPATPNNNTATAQTPGTTPKLTVATKQSGPSAEYKDPNGFKQFRKSMVDDRYGVSQEYMHAMCKDSRISKGVAHCIVYWFRSPNRTSGKVQPTMVTRLYEYKDNASAQAALDALRKSAHPDTGLNYEWNNITVNGRWMYWVSAGCSYSSSNWKKLINNFKSKLGSAELKALVCRCGSGCSG